MRMIYDKDALFAARQTKTRGNGYQWGNKMKKRKKERKKMSKMQLKKRGRMEGGKR
jgi:hypothetical protein